MQTTEEQIRRIAEQVAMRIVRIYGGGGGSSFTSLKSWVDENYLSIDYFSSLFKVYNGSATTANEIKPNDELPTTTTNVNIKAIFGLWTPKFLSALGQGTGGSGGGGSLANLSDVILTNPKAGQILVYRNTHWVNEGMPSPGGSGTVTSVGLTVPTGLLVSGASSKTITSAGTFAITFATGYSLLAAADKTAWDALLDYFDSNGNAKHALVADALSVAAAKTAWGQTYLNANGEPLNVSGNMSDVGDIQMSDPAVLSNGRYIYFDESHDFFIRKISDRFIIQSNGTQVINIYNNKFYSAVEIHSAVGVLSDGYVTALSDIRHKNVIDHFEIDIEKIAAASLIHFTWKGRDDQTVHAGGIAQEWQKILPEAVVESEDGRLAMDYGVIGTAAAVSLARKVKAQQQEIDELKKQNAEMEKRLARLEKLMEKGGLL